MNDPIVEEVRRVREAYAARFNYDLDAIFRDIKEQEKKSGLKYVSFTSTSSEPNKPRQPADAAVPTASSETASEAIPATEQ